ncbi:MAG: ABC transporter ATP-binding protein [Bacillota bacterium]
MSATCGVLIQLQNVSKVYAMGKVGVAAVSDVTLNVARGEYVAVMGPSGSGKSTLLNLMGGLDVPTSGRYLLEGVDVTDLADAELARIRCHHFGFVFQRYNLFPEFTALENVMVPMMYAGVPPARRRERATALLKSLAMEHRLKHYPGQLSGGEQQRVAIARALANEPDVILADEPTGNLATQQGNEILSVFDDLNSDGVTIVMVTHNRDVAAHAKRLILLRDGFVESDTVTAQ